MVRRHLLASVCDSSRPLGRFVGVCVCLMGFLCGSFGKESASNAEDLDSILGWEDPLEKGKATHSSILAWRIPWSVLSVGSQRVGHD